MHDHQRELFYLDPDRAPLPPEQLSIVTVADALEQAILDIVQITAREATEEVVDQVLAKIAADRAERRRRHRFRVLD